MAPFVCSFAELVPLTPIAEAKPAREIVSAANALRKKRSWVKEGASIIEIRKAIDPDFINHAVHYERMMDGGTDRDGKTFGNSKGIQSVRLEAAEGVATIVIDGSREWDKDKHAWETRVRFNNYDLIRKQPDMTWTERARLLMRDNVSIHCSCPAYHFYHQHAATKAGFALLPENRPAYHRNPDAVSGACKHLDHALRYVSANYTTIASGMKRHFSVEESTAMDVAQLWEVSQAFDATGFDGKVPAKFTIRKNPEYVHLGIETKDGVGRHLSSFHPEEWAKIASVGKYASKGQVGFYNRVKDIKGDEHKVSTISNHFGHIHLSHRVGGQIHDYHIGTPAAMKETMTTKPVEKPISLEESAGLSMIMEITKLKNDALRAGMSKTANLLNSVLTTAKLEGASMVPDLGAGNGHDDRSVKAPAN